MSEILSYSNNTTKNGEEDWIAHSPYTDDDIARIKDPDGGLSENPRTAIPSPLAQLDLVKNAFKQLANDRLRGARMNERLVSNALDVAQLFFDYENHKDYLRIIRWNREECIDQLKANPQHRLYGETLDLFLRSDKVYNFDLLKDWYIIMWDRQVLGGTSPASVVMAAPALGTIDAIKVEQGVSLFGETRHLWQRDEDFVCYMYLLMNAYPTLRLHCGEVYAYMQKNLEPLRANRPDLYRRITTIIPNLDALDEGRASTVLEQLEHTYDPFGGGIDVSVLGARFYHKRVRDIRTSASESDFVITPSLPQHEGELPLVLVSGFNGSVEHFRYIDKEWDSATQVFADKVPLSDRKLPDTSIQYPFVTTDDFLTDTLVRLDSGCVIDTDHFFDGNLKPRTPQPTCGYLLPLKPLLFTYFDTEYLKGTIAGRHVMDIEEFADGSVMVTLRIRVQKGENRYIELSRKYFPINDHTWTFDERRGTGRVLNATLSTSVFPFVKTDINDDYTVELFTMIENGGATLRFFKNGISTDRLNVRDAMRSQSGYSTTYYDVDGSWDYMEVNIQNHLGRSSGVIIPHWKPYVPSAKELIFAVDFGTTNTHVEWAERGQPSQPFTFEYGSGQVLVASLHKPRSLEYAEQVQRVEFVPREIDNVYGFPLRSTLARNENSGVGCNLFSDVNIPGDTEMAKSFLRELTLLIKAKALLEHADLRHVEVVYFYPVSMGGADRDMLERAWSELFNTYIGGDSDHLRSYPESLAPAYYYSGAEVAGSSYVSIDIGGGTCDTVIYQPTSDRMSSEPVAISSFRFAGNAIFGDGFTDKDADNNPLLQHYTRYFKQLIENDKGNGIAYLGSILDDIMAQKRSEDINAFLFSIENVEELRTLREIDRNLYSYNALLRNDSQRRLIFMYFYSAIIYYIAQAMKQRDYEMPKQIYFSGTGSKILNILGSQSRITMLSQMIIEQVYGKRYNETFEIKQEIKCPKQITCRGGIRLENRRLEGQADVAHYNATSVKRMRYCCSMLGQDDLTMSQIESIEVRERLVEKVQEFNRFFINLCDATVKDEFGIENNILALFESVLGDNLANYLTAGINAFLKGRYNATDVIEDVPFFYPIIGVIRHNLLKNMRNDVISKFNQ